MSHLRYIVLHHEGVEEPHFDLMFERAAGSSLITIRCKDWPIDPSMPLERLPDHRRIYLDYEGPVSENRGQVRRVASGTCVVEADRKDSALLKLDSGLKIQLPWPVTAQSA